MSDQPDLLGLLAADLTAVTATIRDVAPRLLDGAHVAADLYQEDGRGSFVLASTKGLDDSHGTWVFVDEGPTLGVVTCRVHGNRLDVERARVLAAALLAWAERAEVAA